jgi:glyoxylase-like metal-dependent hydrolase (beta-lactamase superfamily II)
LSPRAFSRALAALALATLRRQHFAFCGRVEDAMRGRRNRAFGRKTMASAMLGKMQSGIYRFQLGQFELTNIADGVAVRSGLHPAFGGTGPADQVHELARANHIDPDKYEHPFIPTVVNTGKELVLFDTGFGAMRRADGAGLLRARLGEAGYKPEDVDVVVFTHGHPDHVAGAMEAGQPAFPNARYVITAAEFDFWKRGENVREARKATRELFVKVVVPLADKMTFIKPGDEVVSGIRAIDAAGHAPGMLAFHVESDGKQVLIWADSALQYVMSLQRPEWPVDVDDDKEKAIATRKRIYDMVVTDKLCAVGYHMPFPGNGYVDRFQGNYRWVPASYQFNI